MDINSKIAASAYAAARPATSPSEKAHTENRPAPNEFSGFVQSLQQTEKIALGSMTGTAEPHALVMALAQTELAVETAVTVRNKVVEAYQEILRMPV